MLDRVTPFAALDFPANPNVGDIFGQWQWDGVRWVAVNNIGPVQQDIPHCGLFLLKGASPATTVQFVPWKGDLIQINGLIYHIPAAGIQAVYNNCYVNGVAGQALAASTQYYIYAFMSGSVMTLDFSTTGYAPSGLSSNMGVMIKANDNTRTLVGVAYTAGNAQFYDTPLYRFTRSWFNRGKAAMYTYNNSAPISNPGGAVNLANLIFVPFAGEQVIARAGWYGVTPTSDNLYLYIDINGANNYQVSMGGVTTVQANVYYSMETQFVRDPLDQTVNTIRLMGFSQSGVVAQAGYAWLGAMLG